MSENPAGPAGFFIPCSSEDTSEPLSAVRYPMLPPPRFRASTSGCLAGTNLVFLITQLPKVFFSSNKWLRFLLGGDQC